MLLNSQRAPMRLLLAAVLMSAVHNGHSQRTPLVSCTYETVWLLFAGADLVINDILPADVQVAPHNIPGMHRSLHPIFVEAGYQRNCGLLGLPGQSFSELKLSVPFVTHKNNPRAIRSYRAVVHFDAFAQVLGAKLMFELDARLAEMARADGSYYSQSREFGQYGTFHTTHNAEGPWRRGLRGAPERIEQLQAVLDLPFFGDAKGVKCGTIVNDFANVLYRETYTTKFYNDRMLSGVPHAPSTGLLIPWVSAEAKINMTISGAWDCREYD